jgi:hypothetical protein
METDSPLRKDGQSNVLESGQSVKGAGDLKGTSYTEARQLVWFGSGDLFSLEEDLPPARLVSPCDDVEESCFARAVGPNDGVSLSLFNLQVDIEKDFQSAEIVIEPLGLQNVHEAFPL